MQDHIALAITAKNLQTNEDIRDVLVAFFKWELQKASDTHSKIDIVRNHVMISKLEGVEPNLVNKEEIFKMCTI